MSKIVSECPACGARLRIAALHCKDCGMELRSDFSLSPFDSLQAEQYEFLTTFLKHRGNLSFVQYELGISYPAAKKRLDNLISALGLIDKENEKKEEAIDMSNWFVQKNSSKASEIVKQKLMENGGKAIVYTAHGLPCQIWGNSDGISFLSDKLPKPFRYDVFDVIIELLVSQGGRARKGNGRNHRLGQPNCDETTVVGAIGLNYFLAEIGKSVYDPVFVLAAVLDWAGIAHNGRGELILTADYQKQLDSNH